MLGPLAQSRADKSKPVLGQEATQCEYCLRLRGIGRPITEGTGWTCDAFPQGIPSEIVRCTVRHNVPYPGDAGTVFEQHDLLEDFQTLLRKGHFVTSSEFKAP